jgi:acyl carrier protein
MSEVQLDPLHVLQATFDEVLPDAKRTLNRDDELVDIGIGSIAALEIAGALQTRYGIHIPDADLYELRTVGDFLAAIERQLNQRSKLEG